MMLRAGVLQRLRALHHQRAASFRNAHNTRPSRPSYLSWSPSWRDLRLSLYLFQLGLFCHFLANHVGFVSMTFGPSMVPTIGAKGDWVLISKLHKKGKGVKVGDLVDFEHPLVSGMGAIKRVAAMPGDFVVWDAPAGDGGFVMREGGMVEKGNSGGVDAWAGDGEKIMLQIPEGHFWALGDNQPESRDSRTYGPLPLGLIKGKVIAKFWPIGEAKWFVSNVQPVLDKV